MNLVTQVSILWPKAWKVWKSLSVPFLNLVLRKSWSSGGGQWQISKGREKWMSTTYRW